MTPLRGVRPLGPVSMSSDGRFVSFETDAWNVVPNDTNLVTDVFVRDLVAHKTVRESVTSAGGQADGFSAVRRWGERSATY